MTTIEGKVAKVLNSREIALNKGGSDGVIPGMKFNVQGLVFISDPDSHETLGSVMRPKIAVEVIEVEPQFSIARSFETYETREPTGLLDISHLVGPRRVPKRIREGFSDEYREDSVFISVGDPVVEILQT